MPLINENRGNGLEDITMKKVRNFNKFHTNVPTITTTNLPVVEGEGLFSGLGSLISSGVKIYKSKFRCNKNSSFSRSKCGICRKKHS